MKGLVVIVNGIKCGLETGLSSSESLTPRGRDRGCRGRSGLLGHCGVAQVPQAKVAAERQ